MSAREMTKLISLILLQYDLVIPAIDLESVK